MRIVDNIKRLGGTVLDLVFPISCLVCGREGTFLCEESYKKLSRLEKQVCLVCQKAAPYGKTHPNCVTKNSVDGAIAGLSYKDKMVHDIIQVFKYNFVSDLAEPLSKVIVEAIQKQGLSDYFKNFIIVPVPLHTRRFNWRGFNQAELLARNLSSSLDIPVDTDMMVRKKFTPPQTTLNANERKKNVENAFELTQKIDGQNILLLDDVVTSGATANEIAKLLKQKKAAEVWVVSTAHG